MNVILNLLWLVLGGGFIGGLLWFGVGVLCVISIVGLPWAGAAFTIGFFTFWPFGQSAIERDRLTGREDIGTGPLGTLGNIIWLLLAGIWLALAHLAAAVALALTIIGIPFAWQHCKLAMIALWPIGMTVVPNAVAGAARRYDAMDRAMSWRR